MVIFLLINSIAFLLMGRDKYLASKNRFRIPEKWFFIMAFLGGALGVLIGMKVFRHKTKHLSFKLGIPCLFIWNLFLLYELKMLLIP